MALFGSLGSTLLGLDAPQGDDTNRLKPFLNTAEGRHGYFPIHLAVKNGYDLLVSVMLKIDGNLVNVQDNKGNTPLHYAAESGMTYCVFFPNIH